MAQHANDVRPVSHGGVGERHAVRRGAEPYLLLWIAISAMWRIGTVGHLSGRRFGEAGDESVAAAVPRLDEARLLRIVFERPAQLLDARRERIVADGRAAPDRGEQAAFRDRLSGVHDELLQHAGRLRRQPDLGRAAPQTSGPGLEPIAVEADARVPSRSLSPPRPAYARGASAAGSWRAPPAERHQPRIVAALRRTGRAALITRYPGPLCDTLPRGGAS